MSSLKSQIIEVAEALSDDCTLDDFRHNLYVRLKAQAGMAAIDSGDLYTREQVAEQMKSWRKSYGQDRP